ncbi:MAG: acetylxylan esterase [Planctomycetales bacterium]
MRRLSLLPLCVLLLLATTLRADSPRNVGPWDIPTLQQVPQAEWGPDDNGIKEVRYAGEPYQGKPTKVFAYYGKPAGDGPFPGMVLVHGGGGKAFRKWVEHWQARGYAAIAMDLAGNGPNGRLADGGPDQSNLIKFREFTPEQTKDMWSYHAGAAVLRAHSLLAAQPGVDKDRIGVTGISWGGYLTCIVAGIDARLKVAVPVYGCGFLGDNSAWVEGSLNKLAKEQCPLAQTLRPSQYLPSVTCPILFINGTNDFAYPLDSYQKSYFCVTKAPVTLTIIPRLPHGHIWTFPEVDTFIDSHLKGGKPLFNIGMSLCIAGDKVWAQPVTGPAVKSLASIKKVELHYTTDTGPWQKREWKVLPGKIEPLNNVKDAFQFEGELPHKRPIVYYLSVTDDRGLVTSTKHQEATAP